MRIARTLLLAGIALGAALAPRAAGADVTLASSDRGVLYVHRVGADRITKVFEERGTGAVAYAFTDQRTLWVVRRAGAGFTIGKVVDGKAEAARPLKLQPAAKLGDAVPGGAELTPGLTVAKGGRVFVTTCQGLAAGKEAYLVACALGYHRADDGSDAFTKARPKDVVFEFQNTPLPRMAALKAPPKGYGVKIVKTKLKRTGDTYTGFSCTGPGGKKLAWPTDTDPVMEAVLTPRVKKATWLAASPPLVHVEASDVSPMGEKLREDFYVVDCTTRIWTVHALGEGLWLTEDQIRKPAGDVIGTLPGGELVLAP